MKKKLFLGFAVLCAAQLTFSACADNPRLIIRADDMGSSHASNEACLKSVQEGVVTSIEVMAVAPWFPETVRLLNANPQIDVGLHLVTNSEWDNIKWRPLTHCPSLTDKNGYFLPMVGKNPNYPGLSTMESTWSIAELEQEFRAQIEFALKNIPQITHISSHMGNMYFDKDVTAMVSRLAKEYHLGMEFDQKLNHVSYAGAHGTPAEKEASFLKMLEKLEPGKDYLFLDHPAYDTPEMQAVYHIGYENVAQDRQGVTDLFTSEKVKNALQEKGIETVSYNKVWKSLPRSTPEAENVDPAMLENYLASVKEKNQNVQSIMVVRNGKVVAEHWMNGGAPDKLHILHSVSKTYTSTAIGFAVQEGLIKVTDKVISFFPEYLPEEVSPNLAKMEIRHLLMMSTGQAKEPGQLHTREFECGVTISDENWIKLFLAEPVINEPGTVFRYNSFATFMLSAIIQKVSGQKTLDFLYPRLFRPLGISGVKWDESPMGINCGGWGLWVKTEDMAKLGQFMLQKGKWNGEQLLSEEWIAEATSTKIMQQPNASEETKAKSDWVQGYCYQMWRCRHNAFRADGANGQFIVVIPEKNAVVAITAHLGDMQSELNVVWEKILPALKD
jgi:CubicO group peptidase (beta-lactamase class C family)